MNWLILRGLVREQRHWGEFPKRFEAALRKSDPAARVVMLDLPGFGTECLRGSPFSIDGIVDDLRSRLQAQGMDGSWGLLALSLGGMVAMNWTGRYPGDFKKAVLVNSSATGLSPLFQRMKPSNYPTLLSLFFESDPVRREQKILSLTTNLSGESLESRAFQQSRLPQVRRKNAFAQIVAALSFRPPAKIEVPLLVLGSKGDHLVDVRCSEALASHFGGQLSLHENGNHDLATDAPDWIVSEVVHWVEQSSVS